VERSTRLLFVKFNNGDVTMFLYAFYAAVIIGVLALVIGLAIDMIFYSSPATGQWLQIIGLIGFGCIAWSWWPFWCLVAPAILG
jgi:hypothetical protein